MTNPASQQFELTATPALYDELLAEREKRAGMVKEAMDHMAQSREGKNHREIALELVKKAHYEDQAMLSTAYATEAQVYATLALADSMAKLAEALLP